MSFRCTRSRRGCPHRHQLGGRRATTSDQETIVLTKSKRTNPVAPSCAKPKNDHQSSDRGTISTTRSSGTKDRPVAMMPNPKDQDRIREGCLGTPTANDNSAGGLFRNLDRTPKSCKGRSTTAAKDDHTSVQKIRDRSRCADPPRNTRSNFFQRPYANSNRQSRRPVLNLS